MSQQPIIPRHTGDSLFRENGFVLVRGLIPKEEAESLADRVARARGECWEDEGRRTDSIVDVPNLLPEISDLAFDPRLRAAVERCIGGSARWLRHFAVQTNRSTTAWHRDGACHRFGHGLDFDESEAPYGVAQILLYLKAAHYGLGVIPRSHCEPMSDYTFDDQVSSYRRIAADQEVSAPITDDCPCLVEAGPGDAVIFDLRLVHAGRPMGTDGAFILDTIAGRAEGSAAKCTVHLYYGLDNVHSRRWNSYVAHHRGCFVKGPLPTAFAQALEREGMALTDADEDLFKSDPRQLDGVYSDQLFDREMEAARAWRREEMDRIVDALLAEHPVVALCGCYQDDECARQVARPSVAAALADGRVWLADDRLAGSRRHGVVIHTLADAAGAGAVSVLLPHACNAREHLRRAALAAGVDESRLILIPLGEEMEFWPVRAVKPQSSGPTSS